MKNKAIIVIFLLIGARIGFSQGFINLNFETTTITTVHFDPGDRYTATVPGWAWAPGQNFVNGDPNSVPLNQIALDSVAVTLHGTNSPYAPAIQGKYSILLQGGTVFSGNTNGDSIGQTAQIPTNAQSITYWGNRLQVTFNGQMLAFNAISNAANYIVWGADVSPYAGQTGQLLFTVPWLNGSILDNIIFSPTAVPEPSQLVLAAFGTLLLGFRCWKK